MIASEFYLDAAEYAIADTFLYQKGLTNGKYPITPEGREMIETAILGEYEKAEDPVETTEEEKEEEQFFFFYFYIYLSMEE